MCDVRTSPEPFYCYYKNKETFAPFNTLKAYPCDKQCSVCEVYQDGVAGYDPRRLPAIVYEVDITQWRVWLWRQWDEDYLYVRSWRTSDDRFFP